MSYYVLMGFFNFQAIMNYDKAVQLSWNSPQVSTDSLD
jgi:hypothetical protein